MYLIGLICLVYALLVLSVSEMLARFLNTQPSFIVGFSLTMVYISTFIALPIIAVVHLLPSSGG